MIVVLEVVLRVVEPPGGLISAGIVCPSPNLLLHSTRLTTGSNFYTPRFCSKRGFLIPANYEVSDLIKGKTRGRDLLLLQQVSKSESWGCQRPRSVGL